MNKKFTNAQLKYFISDNDFFIFLNQYFSTYNLDTFMSNIGHDEENNIYDFETLLRIVLKNVDDLVGLISSIENQISYNYKDEIGKVKGAIKGRLDLNSYIKNKYIYEQPRIYHCMIKEKSYITEENILLIYVINDVMTTLNNFVKKLNVLTNKSMNTEMNMLNQNYEFLNSIIKKGYFSEIVPIVKDIKKGHVEFPYHYSQTIKSKLSKRQIVNYNSYKKLFNWYENFKKNSLSFLAENNIESLFYNDEFSDRLFELWILYKIKKSFADYYKYSIVEKNHLMDKEKPYVFKILTHTGRPIEIYYQKSKNVIWTDNAKTKWSYTNNSIERNLIGIPDIVIKSKNKVFIVDVKNKLRNKGQNSEEIYKMLGYYENFKLPLSSIYGENYRFNGALIFRNDEKAFSSVINGNDGEQLSLFSVSPHSRIDLNSNQFNEICKTIINSWGKEGKYLEVLNNYNFKKLDLKTQNNGESQDSENLITALQLVNHNKLLKVYSNINLDNEIQDIKRKLEKDFFPHIWEEISDDIKIILSMAEHMFQNIDESMNADYAPIILEYTRSIEVLLNTVIFSPFRLKYKSNRLLKKQEYHKIKLERDLTLGEAIYMLIKLKSNDSYDELKKYIESNFEFSSNIVYRLAKILRPINIDFRRKSAHSDIMTYSELVKCRQFILGIGNPNIFYWILDNRDYR